MGQDVAGRVSETEGARWDVFQTPKPIKTSLRREMKLSLSYVMCIVISPCVETNIEAIIYESEMYYNVERGC